MWPVFHQACEIVDSKAKAATRLIIMILAVIYSVLILLNALIKIEVTTYKHGYRVFHAQPVEF